VPKFNKAKFLLSNCGPQCSFD